MYIVIELQKNTEGIISNIVTSHNSLAEAESKYYTILAAAAVGNIPVHSAIIVSEDGFPVKNQCYKH
jgi:predicted regulator of Ras-like GTPase activity (Roadblock/LC7/MglB family)